jgi:pyridoxamine 5'-phosphate oxidase
MSNDQDTEFYNAPQAGEFADAEDPIALFGDWMAEAEAHEPNDPNAMALATVDVSGLPNVRMVLLKGIHDDGFVFYTNLESAKGHELDANPKAALCFHWKSLRRQIRIRGLISSVSDADADAYFASRSKGTRIGAWASKQSRPLKNRFSLEKAVAKFTAKYGVGDVPRPLHWSGYCLNPNEIEFWHDRPFRLHERVVFRRGSENEPWSKTRLYP